MHNNMNILRPHYDQVIAVELAHLSPFDQAAFDRSVQWGRARPLCVGGEGCGGGARGASSAPASAHSQKPSADPHNNQQREPELFAVEPLETTLSPEVDVNLISVMMKGPLKVSLTSSLTSEASTSHSTGVSAAAPGSPTRPEPHTRPRTFKKLQVWSLLKRTLIIGDSNLSSIPPFTDPNLQLDSFPAARTEHFSNSLNIYQQTALTTLNNTIASKYNFIPEINPLLFQVTSHDNIHWTMQTAEMFLKYKDISARPSGPTLVPLITTYSGSLSNLLGKLKANFEGARGDCDALRPCRLISAYRRNKNLQDLLVQTNLNKSTKTREAPRVSEVDFIRLLHVFNPFSREGSNIRQVLTPNTKNAIYAIRCKACHRLYVGEMRNEISRTGTGTSVSYNHFKLHGLQNVQSVCWRAAAAGARVRGERRSGGGSIACAPLTRAD
ncbi:hypothetical protein NQZ68_027168 [Dissostichus eleginoides]|nr:hypothetical protein NQZ68_027168 [Dissostichus eleginoides]